MAERRKLPVLEPWRHSIVDDDIESDNSHSTPSRLRPSTRLIDSDSRTYTVTHHHALLNKASCDGLGSPAGPPTASSQCLIPWPRLPPRCSPRSCDGILRRMSYLQRPDDLNEWLYDHQSWTCRGAGVAIFGRARGTHLRHILHMRNTC